MTKTYTIHDHMLYVDGKQVPFKRTPNKGGVIKPRGLIFHDTASGLDSKGPISWLTNPVSKASAHLVIGRDGNITQLAPFNIKTWHAGESSAYIQGKKRYGLNSCTIGIENVNPGGLRYKEGVYHPWFKGTKFSSLGNFEIEEKKSLKHSGYKYWMNYSGEQLEANIGVAAALSDHYNFTYLGTHWQIAPFRKIDTNPLFPLEKIKEKVHGRQEESGSNVIISAVKELTGFGKPKDHLQVQVKENLNLRKYPSLRSKVQLQLPKDATVKVLRRGNITGRNWWKVDYLGTVGWCDRRYLKAL